MFSIKIVRAITTCIDFVSSSSAYDLSSTIVEPSSAIAEHLCDKRKDKVQEQGGECIPHLFHRSHQFQPQMQQQMLLSAGGVYSLEGKVQLRG